MFLKISFFTFYLFFCYHKHNRYHKQNTTEEFMKTIIVGGGFAGVKAALELSKRKTGKVVLISDEPYFLHHATLYATATGRNMAESVIPLENIFENHPNVQVVQDTITGLDAQRKLVSGSKDYKYDKLILAMGSVTTYFGITGMEKHSFGIKSIDEIKEFHKKVYTEVVEQKLNPEYFIIGAGPTGIELAGALHEYVQSLKALHRLPKSRAKITVVEAAPRILPRSSVTASKKVEKELRKMGITVKTGKKVESLDKDTITIDGTSYPTTTAVWTSGVANNPFFAAHADSFTLNRASRVEVNPYLEAAPHIYVVGDNNTVKHSGLALPAMIQATHVAKNIARTASKRPQLKFRPHSVPSGVPTSERWAYVEWRGIYVAGRTGAWVRRMMELYGYTKLMPLAKALAVWRAHDLPEVDAS